MRLHKSSQGRSWAACILTFLACFGATQAVGQTGYGVQFNGSNQYATSGVTPSNSVLNTPTFTVETWFKRDGAGAGVTTGTGGIASAIPLVAKGTSEAENAPADINYFLGINTSGNVLCADFEEAQTGANPSLNHPVSGTTAIVNGTWYHAAATYNGAKWQLFLNGNLEAELVVGQPANAAVISPLALAASIRSNGTTIQGYFNGVLDEVRLWNYARTQQQIRDCMSAEVISGTGLLGRWGLNEASGATANNSVGGNPNCTLVGTPMWFAMPSVPMAPSSLAAAAFSSSQINLSWTDGSNNEAAFEVQRSTDGGSTFTTASMTGVNTTSYNNTGLSAGTQFWYRVRAINPNQASSYSNTATATTPIPTPAAPSGLTAMATSPYQTSLSWTDNSNNETSFEVWRSTDGGTSFTLAASTAANTVTYQDTLVNSTAQYIYRVRAANSYGASTFTSDASVTTPPEGNTAFQFGSSNAYITFGQATSTLGAQTFTLECWFKRNGPGVTGTTGAGGIENTALPILTKGRNESDGSNVDMNYWLGIDTVGARIAADFEDFATGLNHPVRGTTRIMNGVWYHAAATYDGTTWKLYLNGVLEATLAVGQMPRYDGIQHAGLGTALNSTGVADGFFDGEIDEARIWNYARTGNEIAAAIDSQITSPRAGLLGRWGVNEGSGTRIHGNAGTFVNGRVVGTGSSWVAAAPFDIVFTPPNAPSNLLVAAISNSILQLTWTDNATNETGFEIERSTSGPDGPFTPIGTTAANVVTYGSAGLTPVTSYCYRVRAVNSLLQSAYSAPACGTTLAGANDALDLGSAGAYVTFGVAPSVATPTFTVETWFKRTGTGTANTTGTGGIDVIPLLTKGSPEAEGSTVDANYILGIQSGTNVIAADFEEGTGSTSPGQNHPLVGTTPVTDNVWHHAAATFGNGVFKIYLDGVLENTLNLGTSIFPQGASIQHAGLGTMINSTGVAVGKFQGILDEARIWNYARTLADIRSTINSQIDTPQTGLLARWGLNEGVDTLVHSTAGTTVTGTIKGTGYAWVAGAPFNLLNFPPNVPSLNAPANGATGVSMSATLDVAVSDPDGGTVTVNFYGRPANMTAPAFTVVVLPDAQNYTSSAGGGLPATFTAQTQWCVSNRIARNIVYVSQVGDVTNDNSTTSWGNANTSMSLLDAVPPGIPYGIVLGNHDYFSPPTLYENYFPASRFQGRSYYGGHYGSNNENHYEFFNSDGLEFIVINLSSSDQNPTAAVLDWADSLLKAYSTKRAILINHYITETGNPAAFSTPGQTIYSALKDNPNLFLMLCGHVPGVGRRQDTFNANTVYSLLADFQNEANGGNGWLRIMEFDPPNNQIHVTTYSPTLDQWKTDANNQFDLPYVMVPNTFQLVGTNSGVASGSNTARTWPGLSPSTEYEWYVTVSDGMVTTTSPTWTFTTTSTHTITASAGANGTILPSGAVTVPHNGSQSFTITPNSGYQIASLVVDGLPAAATNPYTFSNVTADHTINVTFSSVSGSPETVACTNVGTNYTFPLSSVAMNFGVLPANGGNVTIRRYPATPPSPTYPDPPAGSTYVPVWFDITSTFPNNTFSATITLDVAGVTGFGTDSKLMYYNAGSNKWVLVSGSYNAGASTFTFTTTHFTPFAFINSSAGEYDMYLSTSSSGTSSSVILPNAAWDGGYPGRSNDWGFSGSQSFNLYIVPQVGMQLGACSLIAEWDSTVVSLDGVSFAGSVFSGGNLLYANWDRLGSGKRVTINASLLSPVNVTTATGSYVACLQMRLLKPGHSAMSVVGDNVLMFNAGSSPTRLYITAHQAEVKGYLGDVALAGDETTGDGKVDFQDLSVWSTSYWSGVVPNDLMHYKAKYDIGPTQDGYVFSLPTYDRKVDFEDLVMFAIAYGQSVRHQLPKMPAGATEPIVVSLGAAVEVGNEMRVPIMVEGGVRDIRGMKLEVGGVFGSLIGVEKGELLRSYDTPVMVMSKADGHTISVDLAVMGLDAEGLNRRGEVAVLRLGGRIAVHLTKAECRSSMNSALGVELVKATVGTAPTEFALGQNYPNPFNPTTTIEYQLPHTSQVTLEVYNILGELVTTLVNNVQETGFYQVIWDGRDENSNPVATGVYLYRVKAGDFTSVKKMVILK